MKHVLKGSCICKKTFGQKFKFQQTIESYVRETTIANTFQNI